ncbi:MAG: peptide-methionine (R)-S-oxide reductase, partial [Rhizobiales bacterium]|nr:peptide-methionine (R)-S-oxide reductase [Hyphomicrobiales bacterium]
MTANKFGEAGTMTTTAANDIDYRKLTDADWRKRLTAEQYGILRKHGTERPGTSPLNHEKRKGTFACAGCDLPLFSSDTKF